MPLPHDPKFADVPAQIRRDLLLRNQLFGADEFSAELAGPTGTSVQEDELVGVPHVVSKAPAPASCGECAGSDSGSGMACLASPTFTTAPPHAIAPVAGPAVAAGVRPPPPRPRPSQAPHLWRPSQAPHLRRPAADGPRPRLQQTSVTRRNRSRSISPVTLGALPLTHTVPGGGFLVSSSCSSGAPAKGIKSLGRQPQVEVVDVAVQADARDEPHVLGTDDRSDRFPIIPYPHGDDSDSFDDFELESIESAPFSMLDFDSDC